MRRVRVKELLKILASVIIALAAVQLMNSCDEPTSPSRDPACGSGNVEWDAKAGVCRDIGRNAIVPASCCGR